MTRPREIQGSPFVQGVDEKIAYALTTTPWGTSPTSVEVKAFSYSEVTSTYTDVSSTVLIGSPTVSGDIITLPALSVLTVEVKYRIEVKFTCSGNIFEAYAWVYAER